MTTITNRASTTKGYGRRRLNLSKRLKCLLVGEMTQDEFSILIQKKAEALPQSVRSIEFHNFKATIHCWDKTILQYSYKRIESIN